MSRIEPNSTPDTKSQQMLDGVQKALGMTPNLYKTMAHSSAVLSFALEGGAALAKGILSGALREQLALTVAGLNGCDYCASAHTLLGKMRKIDGAELARNLEGQSADAKTQAALTFATRIVENRGHVSDADVKAVRDAGYSEGEIAEIIAVTAESIFTNYFNNVAQTLVDFPHVSIGKKSAA